MHDLSTGCSWDEFLELRVLTAAGDNSAFALIRPILPRSSAAHDLLSHQPPRADRSRSAMTFAAFSPPLLTIGGSSPRSSNEEEEMCTHPIQLIPSWIRIQRPTYLHPQEEDDAMERALSSPLSIDSLFLPISSFREIRGNDPSSTKRERVA